MRAILADNQSACRRTRRCYRVDINPNIPVTPILENGQGKRGLAALRIPCADIESRYHKLASGDWGHIINKPLANRAIDGADQLCFAVVTPGGARLDFFAA